MCPNPGQHLPQSLRVQRSRALARHRRIASGPRAVTGTSIPTDYRPGFERAIRLDEPLARRYVAATVRGDAPADAVVAELARHPAPQAADWVRRGIDGGPDAIPEAPETVRAFFAEIAIIPPWFDPDATLPGCRAFYDHSEMFIGAFVAAVLIEGFATLISRSFSITGRLADQGVRRLKQNNRQLVEIFLPGGLDRHGDGWKLSVRIRLVHARVRQLLARSEEWDVAAWGTPISAAHMGFATAAFSGLLLARARLLGVHPTAEERAAFMLVWRYAGHLMGVEPDLQCGTEEEALRLHAVGERCEPAPGLDAIVMANGLINSAPLVAGITAPRDRQRLARRIYRISRAMIGDEKADALRFPRLRTTGALAGFRLKAGLDRFAHRHFPRLAEGSRLRQFQTMLDVSLYTDEGIGYRLPGQLHAERDGTL